MLVSVSDLEKQQEQLAGAQPAARGIAIAKGPGSGQNATIAHD